MNRKKIIGITDCSKYANYEKWILAEPGVEVIRLGYSFGNFDEINRCDGIVLTGGEDIHPRFYNQMENLVLCDKDNMDEKRDEFEWRVLEFAEQRRLPVLGICRGLQMANVFFGGTLVADITSTGKPDHAKIKGTDRIHPITVSKESLLQRITEIPGGEVNSAHHQSAGHIGRGLKINAVSPDGIVEGLERSDQPDKPFMLLVQWHPERMQDQQSPLVKNIKDSFLKNITTL